MKASELIEYLILFERESPFPDKDLEIRCTDRSQGFVMIPTIVKIVSYDPNNGDSYISLDVI
jgi:hypothetical protein